MSGEEKPGDVAGEEAAAQPRTASSKFQSACPHRKLLLALNREEKPPAARWGTPWQGQGGTEGSSMEAFTAAQVAEDEQKRE